MADASALLDTPPRPAATRLSRLASARALLLGLTVAIVAYLALVPLLFVLWQTFVRDGQLSLEALRSAYAATGLGWMTLNSLLFAAGSSALALCAGTVLAYVVVRTDAPLKPLLFTACLVPLVVPGILYTISWIFIASPRIGVLNQHVIGPLTGGRAFDVFSLQGMVLVEGLHLTPLVFLLMVAAFRSMDPSFEESALMSGASLPTVFWRISIRLARPALQAAALLGIVRGLEAFEVPAILGLPGHVTVFTSRIWSSLNGLPPDYGRAGAYALPLLALTSLGVLWHSRLSRRARAFETIRGRSRRRRPLELGRWRWLVSGLGLVYVAVAAALPLLVLAYASTQPFYSPPSARTLSHMSLGSYDRALHDDLVLRAVRNSLVLSLGTATAVMLLAALTAWIVHRGRMRGRWLLDDLAFLPLTIPGLVLGVALLSLYLRTPWLPVYGTLWILFIAYLTRYLPYGVRYASSSMAQIAKELEESAQMTGASWLQTLRRIVLPLLAPGLVAGWIYIVIVSLRELGSSVLLYSPGKEVLSIVIWEQYRNGELTELSALGVVMVLVLAPLVALAYKLGVRDS